MKDLEMITFDLVALQREYILAAKRREIEISIEHKMEEDLNIWEHEEDDIRERVDYKISRNDEYNADY